MYVNALLTREAAGALIAQIDDLASTPLLPITVHIESDGGQVNAFHKIAATFERYATKRCTRIITIGNQARSAAAYLVLCGDPALLLEGSNIFFHGVGWGARRHVRLTRERALAMAMRLDRANRKVAKRMAKRVVFRMASMYAAACQSACGLRRRSPDQLCEDLVQQIRMRVSSAVSAKILDDSVVRFRLLRHLMRFTPSSALSRQDPAMTRLEMTMFKAAIEYEAGLSRSEPWSLDPFVAAEITMDYVLAREFLRDRHHDLLRQLSRVCNNHAMAGAQPGSSGAGTEASMADVTMAQLEDGTAGATSLWCLAVTVCHQLLTGNYTIPAEDAHRMGLVDGLVERRGMNDYVRIVNVVPSEP
jgi:ATP-dependent protease ClpP protease subunit